MKEIIFKMNDGRTLLLTNVIENFGHDDSLPFSAILMADLKGTGHFIKLAKVWNDGWGGLTNIDAIGKKEREICNELDNFIHDNYEFRYCYNEQIQTMSEHLDSMIDNMACLAIDNNIIRLSEKVLKELHIFEKKKELEDGDVVDSPKDIIKAPGVWQMFKRGSDKIEAIYVVTKEKVFIDGTSGKDVTIDLLTLKKSLIDTYQWKLVYKF